MGRLPLFDTHAHVEGVDFSEDREKVIRECGEVLQGFINPGCDRDSSLAAMDLAHKYDFVYAAVGWHPEEIARCTDKDIADLEIWAKDPKVVAIGEIGLDYYYEDGAPKEVQQKWFIEQLHLAKRVGLPVIIHDREAHGDTLELIQREAKGVQGVMHCYSGSIDTAKEYIKLGWYFGFGGTTTFKNAKKAKEVLEWVPEDRILFETDSPYMTPVPFRGKRNQPSYTQYVAENAAVLRNCDAIELMKASTSNAKKLFSRLK